MAARKKQIWNVGSIFTIPLKDSTECLGQVIGREPSALNSAGIALIDTKGRWTRGDSFPELRLEDVFSVILVTRDLLDSGRWTVLDLKEIGIPVEARPYEHLRAEGFVGAKIRGSANVEEFVNAFYGLMPWDDWYIPDYLDDFLISPTKKPHDRLVFSGRHK